MSTANETSVTVTFDPSALNKQSDVIGAASPAKAGVMTAAQAKKLENMTGGAVNSVTGSAPIVSSGGSDPVISIDPATPSTPGSMSAADKTKLDGIAPGSTIAAAYAAGSAAADQTVAVAPEKGGPLQLVAPNGVTEALKVTGVLQMNGGGFIEQFASFVPVVVGNTVAIDAPMMGIADPSVPLIKNLTLPYLGFSGSSVTLVSISGFSWDASGNIATPGSCPIGKSVVFACFGGTFYPNI
jgi:hypothetical protein